MAESMTIKQIAELCGVDERTVRRWVEQAADKMPAAADKMSAAGHGVAATFTLPETLAIIRAGGNETLANLLADNTGRTPSAEMAKGALSESTVRAFLARDHMRLGSMTPAEARDFMGLPPLPSLPDSATPTRANYPGHHGAMTPVSYDRGRNMLTISRPSAFPVSAAKLEKYLGVSRMTFLRWGERLGSRPPWSREQALSLWAAVNRKQLPSSTDTDPLS